MTTHELYEALDAAREVQTAADVKVATIEHLQAEVARLSTPPDDAEVAALALLLRKYDAFTDTVFEAADALTRLSHALAAETAKREAMEKALRAVLDVAAPHVQSPAQTAARATLAKHGSKT